jgi:PAS domain S-box-containing protein
MNEQTPLSKDSILVVDDTPDTLELLATILSVAGYQVRTASSGTLALTSIEFILPDLILLDIMMPQMNGYEVCQALKASPTTKDIPVIFISALNEVFDKVKAFEVGGVDYILKPFQQQEVVARVENQLRLQRLSKQLEKQNVRLQQEIETRKQTEEVLRQSRQLLGSVLDSSLDGIVAFQALRDSQGNIVDFEWLLVNAAAEKIIGRTANELVGKDLLQVLPGNRTAGLFDWYVQVVETGVALKTECDYEHDGIKAWFQIVAVKLGNGFAATFRDITDAYSELRLRQQVELALEQQLHRSQLIGRITNEIRSQLDATAFFETATTQVGQAFGASRALIHTYIAEPTPRIPLLGQYLAPSYTVLMKVEILVAGNPYIELLLSQDQAIAVNDVYAEPLLENAQSLCQQFEIKSMLGVRTSYQDKPNGLIGFHQCNRFREWTEEEIELIEAIAAQLGIAIAQAQLLEQEKQARAELNRQNLQLQQEIAERIQAEEELRHREEQLDTIVTNISDGILILDRQSRVLFANPAASALLNVPLEDLIDYEWGIPIGQTAEIDLVSSSGANRVAEMRVAQTQWLGDSAYIVALRDISDRKQTEEALRVSEAREREKAQALEQTLKDLKRIQSQLIQSEKMSSLGQLVAGIAHEINNPISFIHGNLNHAHHYFQDLLRLVEHYQQSYPNPTPKIQQFSEEIDLNFIMQDWRKLMQSMQVGAERIYQIVVSLRNFSRLDEKELKLVDIHEGIDNSLLILQHRLRGNSVCPAIQVIKDYGQLPPITCYASQLNQVFMNLLNNAIDALYTQPEPRLITIRTSFSQTLKPSGRISMFGTLFPKPDAVKSQNSNAQFPIPDFQFVVIRIADNGSGMNEEVLGKIFDPFFTTKPVGSGTGLGLSICYQIVVEKHKGHISCISAPGKGTEFIVEIPVSQANAQN